MTVPCPPAPHTNVFGVHTEYRPLRVPSLESPRRAGRIAGPVAGLAAGAVGITVAFLRRR